MSGIVALVVFLGAIAALMLPYVILYKRLRRRRVGIATAGVIYDLLHKDKRQAIEVVVQERAGATDPETADDKPPN